MKPEGLGRKLTLELWNYPDASRVLELSTKCAAGARRWRWPTTARAFLDSHGIDLTGEQTTKTRTALEYFAGRARASR